MVLQRREQYPAVPLGPGARKQSPVSYLIPRRPCAGIADLDFSPLQTVHSPQSTQPASQPAGLCLRTSFVVRSAHLTTLQFARALPWLSLRVSSPQLGLASGNPGHPAGLMSPDSSELGPQSQEMAEPKARKACSQCTIHRDSPPGGSQLPSHDYRLMLTRP